MYLNNLSFTNTFANIDKDLYDNADLELSVTQYHDETIASTSIHTAGALYDAGTYTDVPTTGGNGTGATLDLTISSGSIIAAAINKVGNGVYAVGNLLVPDATVVASSVSGNVSVVAQTRVESVTPGFETILAVPISLPDRHDPENLRSHSSLSHGTLHLSHMLTQLLDKHCVCSKLLFRLDGVGVV
eukprot:COSAG01_NODE_187_length_22645_cov_44.301565_4_plen_187_part_00